jgi:hypothetical protein
VQGNRRAEPVGASRAGVRAILWTGRDGSGEELRVLIRRSARDCPKSDSSRVVNTIVMWSTGVGSDVMKPIAAPIIGDMVTSTIHVLIVTPVTFYIMKARALRKGTLRASEMAEFIKD